MRPLPETLSTAQESASVKPALIVNVGDVAFRTAGASTGNTTTCHNTNANDLDWVRDEGGRILKVTEKESPYTQSAEITLNNYDRLLYSIPMKGKRITIGWGADTFDGPIYSYAPAMYVKEQSFVEAEGIMRCVLKSVGTMNLLNEDEAKDTYTDDGTQSVGELIIAVFEATLDVYDECRPYNVVIDGELDDLWSGVYLGDSFIIKKGETRAYTLARLFDLTHASFRAGNELPDENGYDTFHVFMIPESPEYEFTLDRSGHRFYIAAESQSMITPNEIVIKTPTGQTPAYFGRARETYSYNLNPCSRTEYVSGVISSQQAYSVANTMLSKIITAHTGSNAFVPMHCGSEVFDRIKVVSKRSGRTLEGSIGALTRVFDPMKKEPRYDMEISFGKWFDPRREDDSLGYGYGYLGTDPEDTVVVGSGHTPIHLCAPYSVSGPTDWTGFTYGCGPLVASTVNGAWVDYKATLDAGSYKMVFQSAKGTSGGIISILLDDVEIGSEDMYGTATTFLNTFSIAFDCASGVHEFKFKVDGKNPSSSGYTVLLCGCEIIVSSYVGTVI